jgi:hypothetical protein
MIKTIGDLPGTRSRHNFGGMADKPGSTCGNTSWKHV